MDEEVALPCTVDIVRCGPFIAGRGEWNEMRALSGLLRIHRSHCGSINTEFVLPACCRPISCLCIKQSGDLSSYISRCNSPCLTSPPPSLDTLLSLLLSVLVVSDCSCHSVSFVLLPVVPDHRDVLSSSPMRFVVDDRRFPFFSLLLVGVTVVCLQLP